MESKEMILGKWAWAVSAGPLLRSLSFSVRAVGRHCKFYQESNMVGLRWSLQNRGDGAGISCCPFGFHPLSSVPDWTLDFSGLWFGETDPTLLSPPLYTDWFTNRHMTPSRQSGPMRQSWSLGSQDGGGEEVGHLQQEVNTK